jgi:CheY-like chemotaxis protein
MTPESDFDDRVRDALMNLYDSVLLQQHPLVHDLQLVPGRGETAAECLRKLLRETIESLQPPEGPPKDSTAWEDYRILQLHYLRSLDRHQVCRQLNISVATFYRRQRRALEAVISILRQRYQLRSGADDDAHSQPESAADERAQAISLASSLPRQNVDVTRMLEDVQRIVLPLAQQRGIELHIRVAPGLPNVDATTSVLRQITLSMLSLWITRACGRTVELEVCEDRNQVIWTLTGAMSDDQWESGLTQDSRLQFNQELLCLYKGDLAITLSQQGVATLTFTIPIIRRRSILIVDDDPDTIDLYSRYLRAEDYAVSMASSVHQADSILSEGKPDLILLDLMMPAERDGWTVLYRLQESPELASIPIVVCSVLYQPELALALGAARILTKPITKERLLQTVQECLAHCPA